VIQPIIIWPNATLHERSAPVAEEDDVRQVVTDLLDTMYDSGGVGLAAIQIGVPLRIFVMDVDGRDSVFLNPEIVHLEGVQELTNEGCLSLPGIVEQVMRYPTVVVRGAERNGAPFERTYHGVEAQCIQHEVEHLDGIVMADKFSKERQELMRLTLKHRKKTRRVK
jgi:peptide deformylase